MRSTCFFALILVLLSGPALSQEPAVTQARDLVWLEPCPEADSSDVETLKARIDCLEDRSEAMADSQNLLLQNMFLLLEEQFLNEPAKVVERVPAVAHEAQLHTSASAMVQPSGGPFPSLSSRGGRIPPGESVFFQGFHFYEVYEENENAVRRGRPSRRSFLTRMAVPTVVNCVPPLADRPGFVLIGAKLSNWTQQVQSSAGDNPMVECFHRDVDLHTRYVASRSRSEGCYVNRTWFDWYTRRAASEGWPTDDATLCRDEAEERFEETLGNARLLISDRFDVWLDGDRLLYVKDSCFGSEDRFWFFLHVTPVDPNDLPDHRKQYEFDNLDFHISQVLLSSTRRCVAALPLPDYPVATIRTGQFNADGDGARSWEGTFSFTGGEVPQT